MAFVPFVESDQPTMAAFNEKFQQNYEAALEAAGKTEIGTFVGTGSDSHTINLSFTPKIVILYIIPFVWAGSGQYNYGLSEYLEFYFQNATSISVSNGSGPGTVTYSIANNKLIRTYSETGKPEFICNASGQNYGYIAIG